MNNFIDRRTFIASSLGLLGIPGLGISRDSVNNSKQIEINRYERTLPFDKFIKENPEYYKDKRVVVDYLSFYIDTLLAIKDTRKSLFLMPPRTGKTTLFCKYLPEYLSTYYPELKVGVFTYSQLLTECYRREFKYSKNIYTGAFGGPTLGRCLDFIICDDLVQFAIYPSNKYAYKYITEFLETRLSPGGKIVIIQTPFDLSKNSLTYQLRRDSGYKLSRMPWHEFKHITDERAAEIEQHIGKEWFDIMYNINFRESFEL